MLDNDFPDDEIEDSDGGSRGDAWALQPRRESGSGSRKRAAVPQAPSGQEPKRGRRAAAAEGCARMPSYFSRLPLGETPFQCVAMHT